MSRLGRNILYNLAGQGLALVLGFVAVRFIYRDLGDDAVGLIFFALTLNAVLAAALDLSISSTIVREVAARSGSSPHTSRGFCGRRLSSTGPRTPRSPRSLFSPLELSFDDGSTSTHSIPRH